MPFVAARCPQCGGELQLDSAIETGFCMHCGSKIIVQEAIRAVRIDNSHMVATWMQMGDLATESQNLAEAYEYYTKIVEAQPDNCWALFKKGKTAGWQSTLLNIRVTEAAICFAKAIEIAPASERERIIEESTEQVRKLASALVGTRAERYVKWPDQDEAEGLFGDLDTIRVSVEQLGNKSGVVVSGYLEPIAVQITGAAMFAFTSRIRPDYLGDEGHPSKYEFERYLDRLTYCVGLLERAIVLSPEDDAADVQRYEAIIKLHEAAIEACSWDSDYSQWGTTWHKEYELDDLAKKTRLEIIGKYKTRVAELRRRSEEHEAARREETERLENEAAAKKRQEYWAAHRDEKSALLDEQSELARKVADMDRERERIDALLVQEKQATQARINELTGQMNSLGLFKGKDKQALQATIEAAKERFRQIANKVIEAQKPMLAELEGKKSRLGEIDVELNRPR